MTCPIDCTTPDVRDGMNLSSFSKVASASTLGPKGRWSYSKGFVTMATKKLGAKGYLAGTLPSLNSSVRCRAFDSKRISVMKSSEVEYKVLSIIDRVTLGQPVEDSLVELKSQWPPSDKAARQIAGHANAARGLPILRIIGVDQVSGVVGAQSNELENWYAEVKSQFDGPAPYLTDLNIPY